VTTTGSKAAAAKLGIALTRALAERLPITLAVGTKGDASVLLTALHESVDDAAREMFLTGARGVRDLGERAAAIHILPVSELDEEAGAFVSVVNATQSLQDIPALEWPLDRKLECFRLVASAIQALHIAKVMHGCLCPANVLLDEALRPFVSEAGMVSLAKRGDRPPYGAYVAPEVLRGEPVRPTADVYALGRVFAFLLLGQEPVRETDDIPRLDALAESVHAGLVRIIRKCTAKDPETRYANVGGVLSDLGKFGAFGTVGLGHPKVVDKKLADADTKLGAGVSRAPKPRSVPPPPMEAKRPATPATSLTPRAPTPAVAFKPTGAAAHGGPLVPPLVLIAIGGTFVAAAGGLAYVGFVPTPLATALGALGAAALGAGLPPLKQRPAASRALWSAILLTAVVVGGPMQFLAASGEARRLRSADPDTRARAVRATLANGQHDLADAQLADTDLAGADLSNADLRRADLSRANLQRATLVGANLEGAKLGGAKLRGANLAGATLTGAAEAESAECDPTTRLPDGWTCAAEKLAKGP
jgi:hypothetical protein